MAMAKAAPIAGPDDAGDGGEPEGLRSTASAAARRSGRRCRRVVVGGDAVARGPGARGDAPGGALGGGVGGSASRLRCGSAARISALAARQFGRRGGGALGVASRRPAVARRRGGGGCVGAAARGRRGIADGRSRCASSLAAGSAAGSTSAGMVSARLGPIARHVRRAVPVLSHSPRPWKLARVTSRPIIQSTRLRAGGRQIGVALGLPCKAKYKRAPHKMLNPPVHQRFGRSLGQKKGSCPPLPRPPQLRVRPKVNAQVGGAQFTRIYILCVRVVAHPDAVRARCDACAGGAMIGRSARNQRRSAMLDASRRTRGATDAHRPRPSAPLHPRRPRRWSARSSACSSRSCPSLSTR